MDTNEVLRARFDAIDTDEVTQLIARHEAEGIDLDFKQLSPSGDPSKDDARNLKECLSGFANSAGGVVLWGITTKRDGRETHAAQATVPIGDYTLALKRLRELSSHATHPPVDGVDHKEVAVPGGYIIKTIVPQSDRAPHRTNEITGQYYRRGADKFEPMWHHEIEAMFGRRPQPRLSFALCRMESGLRFPGAWWHVSVVIGVANEGAGVAKYPALQLRMIDHRLIDIEAGGLTGNRTDGLERQPRRFGDPSVVHLFAGGGDRVIHSGQLLEVTRLSIQSHLCEPGQGVEFEYTLFADGMRPVTARHRVTAEEIEAAKTRQ